MPATYEVRIFAADGTPLERISGAAGAHGDPTSAGFLALSYSKGVNEIGMGAFTLNAASDALDTLESGGEPILDTQIEVWRWDDLNEIEPYCDFYAFLRDRNYDSDENGNVTYTAILAEQNDLLRRSAILYRANDADRSFFSNVATETILKTLVTYNATTSGTTADGRDRNVDAWGAFVSVEADGAGGTSQTVSCMGENLQDVLQAVANAGGLNYSLVKTGARAWQFRTDTTLGDDRTADVVFSESFGNMRRASLRSNNRMQKTVVTAGGQGVEAARMVRSRTGDNYDATVNSYEVFYNASQYSTGVGLESAADERLRELRAQDELFFEVLQVPSSLYGEHYFLGDLVTAFAFGKTYTPQIRRVQVSVEVGRSIIEAIEVTLADA